MLIEQTFSQPAQISFSKTFKALEEKQSSQHALSNKGGAPFQVEVAEERELVLFWCKRIRRKVAANFRAVLRHPRRNHQAHPCEDVRQWLKKIKLVIQLQNSICLSHLSVGIPLR
jgi:hypothetical protein